MATNYLTRDGDVLDAVCSDVYGVTNLSDAVVRVLDANPGLADVGPVLPGGLLITLPVIDTSVQESTLTLWD